MNTPPKSNLILVLGGTGKTGRRILERLAKCGHLARSGSRSATIPFDWDDQATWPASLAGVSTVYVSFQPDLCVPGALETIRSFAELAVSSGVEKLVLLSGRGEIEATQAEEVIKKAGVRWTILRASWFNQNFSESFLVGDVHGGTVALPISDVGEPFIDVEDIADVAVAALTEPGHDGQLYEITGPRLLSFSDAVNEIATIGGLPVRYEQVTPEQYKATLDQYDVPKEESDLVMYLFTTVLDGRNSYVTDGVQRALGRPPRDFTDYVRQTAPTGVWAAQQ